MKNPTAYKVVEWCSFHSFFFSLSLGSLDSDFFVVLLEGGEILSGFGEFSFLHTLSDVPMHEGSLGVHEIELVIDSREHLSNGGGVGDHADGSHDLGEISSWDDGGRLVVDSALEASGAPVDELDGSLGLDGGDGSVHILGDDITSVHEAASHVLSVSGVALGHHGGGLEGRVGDFGHRELLVVGLLGRDDGSVGGKHEMDSGVGHQVGLELSHIDVQGTIESQRGSQRGDNLSDESVQVGVGRSLNVEVPSADVIDGFIVEHDGHISVLQERMGGEHGVVWLNHSSGHLGGWVHSEAQLGFLSVVHGESFQEERSETGASSSSDRVEHEETLETSALVSKLSDSVQAQINDFLSNGVMASGEVVGGIFFSGDELFGMEQLSVGSSSHLIDDSRLQVEEDASGDVLSGSSLGEESVEGIISSSNGLIGRHLTVWLDSVLKTEELPACITDLDTGLSNVD
mmetsp:Transcript_36675/g.35455  ORF Transcript_36675/g.35455 Transcript_36675/m.35455 type:complete len:459 (+) Transcript_36675:54-1430(+)